MDVTMRKNEEPNYISLKVGDELYELIWREAQKRQIQLIDVVVQAVAEHFKKPELGYVPRKPRGPKPKKPRALMNGNGKHRAAVAAV